MTSATTPEPAETAPEDAVPAGAAANAPEAAPAAAETAAGRVDDAAPEAAPAADAAPEATADEAPAEDASAEDASADEAASAEPSTEEPLIAETPTEEASTEETPPEEAPTEETPTEEASTEEPPTEAAPAEDAPVAGTPAPTPAMVPTPAPGPRPGPMPRRPAPGTPAVAPRATTAAEPWGRVDDDGTVSVRDGDDWRVVGQYPDGTPEEALAYFERKFADLAGEVALLEERHRRGGASASDLRSTAKAVRERVSGAMAVGDLGALEARLTALEAELSEATAEEVQAQKAAVEAAIAERTTYVERIEAIAARDPKSIQWKQTTAEVTTLFEQWQAHQATGPRLPKSTGQQLWKRFRDARSIIDKHRREFYSSLDEQHKGARDTKTRLIERAEALAPRGEDGIGAYRDLLDLWKSSGRAGKKVDDALWARFKAAGDVLYGARVEREHEEVEASKEKIAAKRELIAEAAGIAKEKNTAKARSLLTGIQRRWDDIGRVFPRDVERGLDDDLRKIEQGVKSREETEWKSNNPETKARQNDMTQQLQDAIVKLEEELAAAEKTKDKGKIAAAKEALEARRGWLKALGG